MPKAAAAVDDDYDYDAADQEEADIDDEELPPAPPPVVRKVAKPPTPVVGSSYDDPNAPSNREFDQAIKERKNKQAVAEFMERKKAEETVDVEDITELLLLGDQGKIVDALHNYCSDNLGIKKAKKLLREARDAAKGRITRVAGFAEVTLDEFKSEQEAEEKSSSGRY